MLGKTSEYNIVLDRENFDLRIDQNDWICFFILELLSKLFYLFSLLLAEY